MKFTDLKIPEAIDKSIVIDWTYGSEIMQEFTDEEYPNNYNILINFKEGEGKQRTDHYQFIAFFTIQGRTMASVDYDSNIVSPLHKVAELLSKARFK